MTDPSMISSRSSSLISSRISSGTVGRRRLLGGALSVAAVGPLLAGCQTVTRSTDIAAINAKVTLPDYVRFSGPKPDLKTRDDRMPDAYRHFPSDRPTVLSQAPGDGSTISGSVPTSSPIPPTEDRNQYWQALNERLGSPLSLAITPSGDYPNKFATSVAGDTLGDLYNVDSGFAYLPQFLEARAQNLTEFLSGPAIRDYPFLANLPTDSWRGCVYSGGIYAVPVPRGILNTQALFARADLFKAKGVDPTFTSVDELLALARAMTDERANRWAFTNVPQVTLSRMLGLPNAWAVRDGKLVNENELEEHKQMLALGARLIKDGLVHPDSTSSSQTLYKTWFNEGSAAMIQDTYTAMPAFYQQNVAGDAFEVAIPVVPGPDGTPSQLFLGAPNNSITAIDQTTPERTRMLLELLNWCAAPFGTSEYLFRKFGLEGRHFDFVDGDPVLTKIGNSETALGAFPTQYFTDCPMPIYYAGHPEATDTVYDNLNASLPTAVQNPTYGLYSPTSSTKGKTLSAALGDATNQILLGRQPVSSWDAAMDAWRRGGGDAVRSEYEQALATKE